MSRLLYSSVLVIGSLLAACGDGDVNGDVVVESLDFGLTNCGTTANPRVLIVTNNSPNTFTFAIETEMDSNYTVIPPAGVVLPRSQATVTVVSKAIPAISAVDENFYGETLTVTTSRGDEIEVAVTQTAQGAILQASSETVTFATPQAFGAAAQTQSVAITNRGNLPASISVVGGDRAFAFAPAGDQTIAPAGVLNATLSYTSTATTAETTGFEVTAAGTLCSEIPQLTATGTGTALGLAAQVAIAQDRGRTRNAGGLVTVCVLTTTGQVACSGSNSHGARGTTDAHLAKLSGLALGGGSNGTVGFQQFGIFNLVETATGLLDQVVEIHPGRSQFCARRQSGDVMCWGAFNGTGGQSTIPIINPFAQTRIAGGVSQLAGSYSTLCRLSNTTMTCSFGGGGQALAGSVQDVTKIAASGGTGYGLLDDGTVISFGKNRNGERGDDSADGGVPAIIPNLSGVVAITAGGATSSQRGNRFACALLDDESVACWGANRHGQLANGTNGSRDTVTATPAPVLGSANSPIGDVQSVAAGHNHACAMIGTDGKSDPSVVCWGRGSEGQIGSGTFLQNTVFVEETDPAIPNAASLGLGGRASCAVLTTGGLTCWGQIGGELFAGPTTVGAFQP